VPVRSVADGDKRRGSSYARSSLKQIRRDDSSKNRYSLYVLFRSRLLLAPAISSCIYNFFAARFVTIITLFLVRELELSAVTIGISEQRRRRSAG
jgi:hypothetical protein